MQVQNFIAGIKPIQSIIRIGSAAGQLLAIPAEALRGRPESFGHSSRNTPTVIPISRQLQRGIFGRPLYDRLSILHITEAVSNALFLMLKAHQLSAPFV